MNSAEQTVTWLITLGVLESPKKTISDPEAFLQSSLKDGVVLCRLLERLSPGSTEKVRAIITHSPSSPALPCIQPTARPAGVSVCRCPDPSKPTRFVVWLLFLPTGPWGDLFCRSRQPGLLSAKNSAMCGHMMCVRRVWRDRPLFPLRIDLLY